MPLNKSSELRRKRSINASRQNDDFVSIGESSAIREPEIVTEQKPEIVTEQKPEIVTEQEPEAIAEQESDIKSDDSVSDVEMHPVIKPEYSQKYKYR